MKINYNLLKIQLRKKINIFSILVISISMCFVLILCSYKASVQKSINDSLNDLSFRSLSISSEKHVDQEKKSILENIEHVTNVSYEYYYRTSLKTEEFKNDKLEGSFEIISANNKTIPQIVKGTNFPDNDDYYMVCPENFYPGNFDNYANFSDKDRIDLDKYLNKQMIFNSNEKNFNIKLIGIYQNSDYNLDEYLCYVNEKTMIDIMDNYYNSIQSDQFDLENQTGFIINIDDAKNLESVKTELSQLGYNYKPIAYIAYDIIDNTVKPINKIIPTILILVFILIFILLEKDFKEDKKFYKLLSYLGYNNKYVIKIYTISSILKLLFCLFLSILLTSVGYIIFLIILKYHPFIFGKYRLILDIKSIIYIIGVLMLTLLLSIILNKRDVGI